MMNKCDIINGIDLTKETINGQPPGENRRL